MASSYLQGANTDDLVTISIDSKSLSSVVSALMKTIESQGQCIETLNGEISRLDIKFRSEIDRVTDEMKEVVHGVRDDVRRMDTDVYAMRGELAQVQHILDQRASDSNDAITRATDRLQKEMERLNSERQFAIEREARLRSEDVVAVRDAVLNLDKASHSLSTEMARIKENVTRLDQANVVVRSDIGELAVASKATASASAATADDVDNVLQLFALTRAQVASANAGGPAAALSAVHSTPAFRTFATDFGQRVDDIVTALRDVDAAVRTKADAAALSAVEDAAMGAANDAVRSLRQRLEELETARSRNVHQTESIVGSLRAAMEGIRCDVDAIAGAVAGKVDRALYEDDARGLAAATGAIEGAVLELRNERVPLLERHVDELMQRTRAHSDDLKRAAADIGVLVASKAERGDLDEVVARSATKRDLTDAVWSVRQDASAAKHPPYAHPPLPHPDPHVPIMGAPPPPPHMYASRSRDLSPRKSPRVPPRSLSLGTSLSRLPTTPAGALGSRLHSRLEG